MDNNLPYLFAAYTVVWAGLFGYVLSVFWRQRGLRESIDTLRKHIDEKKKA